MAKITKSYDSVLDLTVFKVEGEAIFDEIWEQTRTFLGGKPSKLTIWDFTMGTLAPISGQEMEGLAKRGSAISPKIEGGKAALVTPYDLDYGIVRAFQVFSEIESFPLEIEVFRDMNTAWKWLIPD